jgi:hypothetical protein
MYTSSSADLERNEEEMVWNWAKNIIVDRASLAHRPLSVNTTDSM